ncbi:sensor histidine kinase [Sphingomonas immobilis]|uniref:histidine kinase n=1 Tax=Sphingomonas immobilis TaxID=3063997 RepID=A0ABT9A0D1_9SPHN|nr:HAMP domain-containing sensor histidine kinase [Sphingomonas sp. CA1-15]MDO7843279.1 HAMP domain-containing sensor histidine kinase [Sphingomonas sp. CA1-15]
MPATAGGRSIAVAIFALVAGTVLLATIGFFAITFIGPPPRTAPALTWRVAEALKTGTQPRGPAFGFGPGFDAAGKPGGPPPYARAPQGPGMQGPGPNPWRRATVNFVILNAAQPPAQPKGWHADPARTAQIASVLGVPADRVRLWTAEERQPFPDVILGAFTAAAPVGSGWRTVSVAPGPWLTQWHLVTLAAMLGILALLVTPAWLIARAISRPLRRLAAAASAAHAGAPLPALPASGPREVVELTGAVASMHARLERHAAARTEMLAAIAHDLGTPLSRLAFRVESLPAEARDRAAEDIAEMRGMIGAVLSLARDEAKEKASARVDLESLLDALVEDAAATGAEAALTPGARAIVRGDPGALRRLFQNLIDNALRYGGEARITWYVSGRLVTVTIDDAGPGIDAALAERLFEPFVRGDPSRNRETGGSGLGLSIVRSIAVAHGGSVSLGNRTDGPGARATVTLPTVK